MSLTPAQALVVHGDIALHPELASAPSELLVGLYNQPAVPAFWVWQQRLTVTDLQTAIIWQEYMNLSDDARAAWLFMVKDGDINPSQPEIRQGILDIFGGPQQATTRANLLILERRQSSRIEKLLATGTGTTVDPATMGFVGPCDIWDILQART